MPQHLTMPNDPAAPTYQETAGEGGTVAPGLTKREAFASAIMANLASRDVPGDLHAFPLDVIRTVRAREAVAMADALIAALNDEGAA